MHINDWAAIQTLFDKLNKQLEKALKAAGALGVPRPYIKLLVELEDFLNKTLAGKLMFILISFCLYAVGQVLSAAAKGDHYFGLFPVMAVGC